MAGKIRLVAVLVTVEAGGTDDVFQEAADVAVKVGLVKCSVFNGGDDALNLVGHAGFHEIVACVDGGHSAFLVAPVGHDDAAEAPLVPEDGGEETVVLLGKFTVDFVVGAHHCPGIGLLDGNFKALEVEFAKDTGAEAGVILHAVYFLVVGCKVFYGNANAVALDAAYVCCGHFTGEEGIL